MKRITEPGAVRRLLSLLLLLILAGCSSGGSHSGGTAAPPAGPASTSSLQLKLELPPQQKARLSAPLTSVDVEIVDPGTPDPGTLSGRRLIASGHASVSPNDTSVLVLIGSIIRGTWDIYAFGRGADGQVLARSQPGQLSIGTEALVLTLQLVPVGDESTVLNLTPQNPTLAVGTHQLFTVTDSNGLDLTSSVTWSSSDPSVASIDAAGSATALAVGSTLITATLGSASVSTTLTVTPATVVSLAVNPPTASVAAGLATQFSATGTLSDGTTQDLSSSVTWSSGPEATVDGTGLATGLTVGQTQVTATFNGLTASATLDVTPAQLVSIAVAPKGPATLTTGFTRQFTATGTFTDATTADITTQVTWSSDNASAVPIDAAGLATARNNGTANLIATLNGLSDSGSLTGDARVRFQGALNTLQLGANMTVARGDWNGDGRMDVAAVTNNQVQMYLNSDVDGQPVFLLSGAQLTGFGSTGEAGQLAVGDVNGDTLTDIVEVSKVSNEFGFFLGNGNGTFGAANVVAAGGTNPRRIAVGDFDGDNRDDVAVTIAGAGPGNDEVDIHLSGPGGPTAAHNITVVQDTPYGIAVARLNNDTFLDLVVAHNVSNTVQPLLGTGTGTFTAGASQATGLSATEVAVGRFNGDNFDDAVVVNQASNSFSYFQANGAGGLNAGVPVGLASNAVGIATGDFDGDGNQDVAATLNPHLEVSVLRGNGNGTFQAALERPISSVADFTFSDGSPVIADFDLDGTLDALVGHVSDYFSLILNTTPANPLQTCTEIQAGLTANVYRPDLAVADYNGDGHDDVAIINADDSSVSVLLGDGAGTLTPAPGNPYATPGGGFSIKAGDMNKDGRPDVVMFQDAPTNAVSVLLSNADGSLQAPLTQAAGFNGNELRLGDFNNDGNLDCVVGFAAGTPNVFLLLGNGDGTLNPPTGSNAGGGGVTSVGIADLNHDGNLDVVAPNLGSGIDVFLGTGGATLPVAPSFTISPGAGVFEVLAADFDGDTFADVATFFNGGVAVFFNQGDGTFSNTPFMAANNIGASPWRMVFPAPDMDQNGLPDIVTQDNIAGGTHILLCHTDRTITDAGQVYDIMISGLQAGRFNADPRPDLISCGESLGGATNRVLLMFQQILNP